GKGDREDLRGPGGAGDRKVGDGGGEDARLAGAGPRQHQERAALVDNCLALVLVQPVEMGRRCHGTAFRRGFGRHGVVGNFERIGGGGHAPSSCTSTPIPPPFPPPPPPPTSYVALAP